MKVLVFGDANVDVTVRWESLEGLLPRLSQKKRQRVLSAKELSEKSCADIESYRSRPDRELSRLFHSLEPTVKLGGCGAIKAKVMSELGHDVSFYSWVGDDDNGRMILDRLSEAGVDVSNIARTGETAETYNAFDPSSPRIAFSHWMNKLDLDSFISDCKREEPDAILLAGAHRFKKPLGYSRLPGAYVFTGSFMTYSREELARKYESDFSKGILVGNNTEVMQLAGNDDILSAMGSLPNNNIVMHGPRMTAVKRGSSIVTAGTGKIDRRQIRELTGIGDTWEATFIAEVGGLASASEEDLIKAMKKASRAAKSRMLGK